MKKKITALALAVCILVVGIVGATTAYFTDKKEATNTFTFGKGVEIELTETTASGTTESGEKILAGTPVAATETVPAHIHYDNVVPGCYYSKKPTVELLNDGKSAPAYIVVTATFTDATRPFNLGGKAYVGSEEITITPERIGNTYFYYFPNVIKPGTTVSPFEWIQLDPSVNNADTNENSGTLNVEVRAYAILAAGFNDCKTAFNAAFGNNAEFNGVLGESKSVAGVADAAGAATFTLDTAPVSQKQTTVALTGLTAGSDYTLDATTYDAESATVPGTFTVTDGSGVIAALDLKLTDADGDKAVFEGGVATVVTYIAKGIEGTPEVKYTGTEYTGGDAQPTAVTYDKDSGKLTFKTTHFSNFAVLVSEAAYNKTTNTAYETLADAIEAVNNGDTVVMTKDVAKANGISVASGKSFTVDFNGYTYSVEKPGAGSAGTTTQAFQLLKDSTITFKNGTINCTADNAGFTWQKDDTIKGVAMVIQNYCNLTLDNMTIDGANIAHNGTPGTVRYVISNNCGATTIKNSTITAVAGDFAFDSCKYGSYTIPTVNVIGSEINGKVEATGGKINFQTGTTVNGQVRVGENIDGTSVKDSVVTIENGATVNAVVAVFGQNTLNVEGTVKGYIATNGNAYNKDSVVNIKDGANIVATGVDVAVYIPNGTLNISGGTITGETAVYFKSTKLNITGGTLIGNGTVKAYNFNGNGADATGDALVIDSCNYPSGLESKDVTISGGTFKSTNNNAVKAFTKDETCTPVTSFISGGKFSSNPDAAYLADGATTTEVNGYWTVTAPSAGD